MKGSLEARFWGKVNKTDSCWIWTGYINHDGYGRTRTPIRIPRRPEMAHRIAYELLVGPIPNGLEIDHFFCKRRACVNPAHLELVTHAENNRRSPNPKKTHCRQGHPYAGDNLVLDKRGAPNCRTCRRQHSREYEKTRIRKKKQ